MNKNGVLTTWTELHEHGFDDYKQVPGPGTYLFRLDFKAWHKRRSLCLICYFSDEEGNRFKMYCWRKENGGYAPRGCPYDFSHIRDGSWWECTVRMSSTDYPSWVGAKPEIRNGMTEFWYD